MRRYLAFLSICPFPLVAAPALAQELPSGSSAAFRERMVDWASPEPVQPVAPAAAEVPSNDKPARSARISKARLPYLSSGFGYRDHPILGRRAMHTGIDIPGRMGSPIYASESGVVRFSGRAGGYGEMIEIDHGNGMSTRYAHLSRLLVTPGTPISRGEEIALMGSTGRSTGSHLHFEVRVNGRAANPIGYLTAPYSFSSGSSGESVLASRMNWDSNAEPYFSRYAQARRARQQK